MPAKKPIVYLEDLETPAISSSQSTNGENTTVTVTAKVVATATKDASSKAGTAVNDSKKRQRSILDMLGGGATSKSTESSTKKIKLDKSGSSADSQSSKTPTLNSIPFSLSAYTDTFSEEEKRLLALECETMGKSWLKVLKDEIRKPYFLKLKTFLWEQGVKGPTDSDKNLKVYPEPKNIYAWSNLTPLGRVKVVIIGQDPYHGPKQAHGLCFSVPQGVSTPPSLRNIYSEIRNEYPTFEPPKHGNLTSWAENGVLLLNTALTVKAGAAGSHSNKGWEEFTDKVIDIVDRFGGANLASGSPASALAGHGRGIVFLAWGAWAAKRVAKLDKAKHLILTSAHPSPLSAHRGFLGNGHFKTANEWLEKKYGADGMVDWCKL